MAHTPMRDQLVALANSTVDDPMGFLEGLSDIHDNWHGEFVRTYGFLLFHHRVVGYFTAIVNPRLEQPVTPYSPQDLQALGVSPFQPANLAAVDTLGTLATFSGDIESWHNTTHGQLAAATQTPMLDARQNIFFRPFWRLHLHIDGFFQTVLRQYGDRAHPNQFLTVAAVAGHIEVSHHDWVTRI